MHPHHFAAPDGTRLAYRTLGSGRPVVLLHGFMSTGTANWIQPGHAALLAERGHRVVVADLRAHGGSARPGGATRYPPDVLADDALALVEHLGLSDYDLAGYSLGARTVFRMLARGATPRRVAVGGQGLRAITQPVGRVLGGGTEDWLELQWRARVEHERIALRHLLETALPTPRDDLVRIVAPTLVIMGRADDPTDGRALADALLHGSYVGVPGDHFGAAGRPELGLAIADHFA